MKKLKLILFTIVIIFTLSLSGVAFWYGRRTAVKELEEPKVEITAEIILDKITEQYFIVTQTLFFDEEITLTVDEGSSWSNLLLGEEIIAEGIIRVDIGVDMQDLSSDDIQVDHQNKVVRIRINDPEVLDTSLTGDISIETKKGIIAHINDFLDEEEGEDYNKAVLELTNQAAKQAMAKGDILEESKHRSIKLLELVINSTGYTVEVE